MQKQKLSAKTQHKNLQTQQLKQKIRPALAPLDGYAKIAIQGDLKEA